MSYGKIFESVFTGSLFGSGPTVFAVWAYVIATARPPGVTELNPKLLAACIGTDIADVRSAIELLCAPDPDSRTKDHDGCRLVHLEAMQYQVVSFQKYRDLRDMEAKRAADRDRIASKRANVASMSPPVAIGRQVSPQAEAEAEVEVIKPLARRKRQASDSFGRFWEAYPRKASKGNAEKAWASLAPDEQLVGRILAAIERARTSEQWRSEGGKFIPYPATWLRARGWEDGETATKTEVPAWMKNAI